MQLPDRHTPVPRCEALSKHVQHAMHRFVSVFGPPPTTASRLESLASLLAASTDALVASQTDYRAAVIALVGPRVEVKLVDLKADDLVRSVKRAADEAGKDVSAATFPDGVTPIIKPVGPTEVSGLRGLEGRIAATAAWAEREAQRARVEGVRVEYETALANRRAALAVSADKKALRDAAKESFLDTYAAVAGAVKELFPRDRARQDVFFDAVRTASVEDEDGDEPDEPGPPSA